MSFPGNTSRTYLFRPRGLDARKRYEVTFENSSRTAIAAGSSLMRDGLALELPAEPASELLLFERRE